VREVRLIRSKLQTRKNAVLKAGSESVGAHLRTFLTFVRDTPILSSIVRGLPKYQYDELALTQQLQRGSLALPDDEPLRAGMCLQVLENNADDSGLEKFAITNFTGAGSRIDDMIHAFISAYIVPLYDYLDEQLAERETWISPADIAYEVQSIVDNTVASTWQSTVERLQSAYQLLFTSSSGPEYAAIGNLLRDALLEAATEVFSEEQVPPSEEQPKGADAKSKVRHAL